MEQFEEILENKSKDNYISQVPVWALHLDEALDTFLKGEYNFFHVDNSDVRLYSAIITHMLIKVRMQPLTFLGNNQKYYLSFNDYIKLIETDKTIPPLPSLLILDVPDDERTHFHKNLFEKLLRRLSLSIGKKMIVISNNNWKTIIKNSNLPLNYVLFSTEQNSEYVKRSESSSLRNADDQTNEISAFFRTGVIVNPRLSEFPHSTKLQRAAKDGNLPMLLELIRFGARHLPNDKKNTPLHLAAKMGHNDIVIALLENMNIDINITNRFNMTALHKAAIEGHTEVGNTLMEYGIDICIQDTNFNYTALHSAVHHGNCDFVAAILKHYETKVHDLLYLKEKEGRIAIHLAARNGNLDIAKLLLNCDRQLEIATTDQGETIFNIAQNAGKVDFIAGLRQFLSTM